MPSEHAARNFALCALGLSAGSGWIVPTANAQLAVQRVADLNPSLLPGGGAVSSAPTGLAAFGGRVCFVAAGASGGVEPFVGSANPPGAASLGDLRAGGPGSIASAFTALAGGAVFIADDGLSGAQLWWSDGTAQGTGRVSAISGGVVGAELAAMGGRVYFAARDLETGVELWSSDGTMAGTARVADVRPGSASSKPLGFAVSGSRVYFLADDGVNGRELWMSDGSGAGTVLVGPLAPPGLSSVASPIAARLEGVDGVVVVVTLFVGTTATPAGSQLWFCGATGTPSLLATLAVGDQVMDLLPLDPGVLMVTSRTSAPFGVMLSLVLASGARQVIVPNLSPNAARPYMGQIVGEGSRAFFAFDDQTHGIELWTTDLTAQGTRLVADLVAGRAPSNPAEMTMTPDGLYFTAYTEATGVELYRADLCGNGVTLAADINPGAAGSDPQELTLAGGTLYFRAVGAEGGQELYGATLPGPAACPADFNHDGELNADDLAEFIAAYFGPAPGSRVDFNHDCGVNADDLSDYITAYFAGC